MNFASCFLSTDTPQVPAPIPKGKKLLLSLVCPELKHSLSYITIESICCHANVRFFELSIFKDVIYRPHDVTVPEVQHACGSLCLNLNMSSATRWRIKLHDSV